MKQCALLRLRSDAPPDVPGADAQSNGEYSPTSEPPWEASSSRRGMRRDSSLLRAAGGSAARASCALGAPSLACMGLKYTAKWLRCKTLSTLAAASALSAASPPADDLCMDSRVRPAAKREGALEMWS